MATSLLTLVMAAAIGQSPAEAGWLKSVPADVDVVIHAKGLRSTRDDLARMLEAMSPNLARMAGPRSTKGSTPCRSGSAWSQPGLPSSSP